jgi:hypothetical protein
MEKAQENLHSVPVTGDPGSANMDVVLRSTITEAIRHSPNSRDRVAEDMSALLGVSVTVRILNAFTSEANEQHRFPLAWTIALCIAINDWRVLRLVVERAGFFLIEAWQRPVLELGERMVATRMSQREIESRVEEIVNARSRP